MASSVPAKLFTEDEVRRHKEKLDVITATAAKYLDDTYADHLAFHQKWGVSKYYGNRRKDYATKAGRVKALESLGKPASLADQQVGTACISLAMLAMQRGFAEAGMQSTWKKINDVLKIDNKFYGTDLQVMLRQLGWKIYYWNPDPQKNAEWDAEDRKLSPPPEGKKWHPVWGGHASRYDTATKKGNYAGTPVDDAKGLVGFGAKPPAAFGKLPFFIGTAHDGYHVFPGRRGDIIEAHSMRNMDSVENLEFSKFNPLGTKGGPRWTRTEKYRSGVVVVPAAF